MKSKLLLLIFCCSIVTMQAGTYLVSNVQYGANGTIVTHKHQQFVVGKNIYNSFSSLLSTPIEAGSTIYVADGIFTENITLNIEGLTLLGNNAFGEKRSNTRTTAESILKGKLTIAANNITINGFQFTENGCVENMTATNTEPLSGFQFIYNDIASSSLTHASNIAVVNFGKGYNKAAAKVATAHCRYKDFTIAHNAFAGGATSPAHFIILSGSFGKTNINDNTFNDGGGSITLNNAQGNIAIDGNNFKNVGDPARVFGSTYGEFAIYLYYFAYSNSTNVDIVNNTFDNCKGRSSLYSTLRFYNGDANDEILTPVKCNIHINHNIFRNKPIRTEQTHNYIAYANYIPEANIDTRFNEYDISNLEFAQVKQPWETTAQRNYASSYELIDFASSAGTTFGYWADPLGGQVKDLNLEKSTRVHQSFDIDEKTGDIFFVQIYPKTSWTYNTKTYNFKHKEPMVLTRYYVAQDANGKDYMRQQRSYLDMAGHCQNMAVCWYKGVRYIVTGGDGKTTDTQSDCTSFIPWQAGVYVDLSPGNTKFSYYNSNGVVTKNYEVIKFYNHLGKGNPYPAVDNTSQIFCERNTSGANVRFCFYHLGDVIENPTGAKPIKEITIKKYHNGVNGDNPNTSNIGSADHGFQTWSPQGFTVSGDYLYHFEGMGESDASAINGEPTCIIHAYNWKTDKFAYRKRIKKSEILNAVHGEPEGIKVHRDKNGVPCLLCGIATGASGARKANIVKYTPAMDVKFEIPVAVSTPSVSSITFTTNNSAAVSPQTFTINNAISGGGSKSTINGALQLTLAGEDAACFNITASNTGAFDKKSTIKIGFTPKATQVNYSAALRISSPNAKDVIIPIVATNNLSNYTNLEIIDNNATEYIQWDGTMLTIPNNTLSVEVYNTVGTLCCTTTDLSQLNAGIYIVRCQTTTAILTKKIQK